MNRYLATLLALLVLCLPASALAKRNGSPVEGCNGCHTGGKSPTVTITPDLMTVNPGQTVTLSVSISQTNGTAAGFYIEASAGKLSVIESGTTLNGNGITHSAPRTGSGGNTTFKVGWTAPAAPGGVDFEAWGNSVNSNNSPSGDSESEAFYSLAFGCAGTKFYHDYDGDGVGAIKSGYSVACAQPMYYSAKIDDCNDNDPKMFPGSSEICDGKDNNCDGQIDEGLPITAYCADADGDGHGVSGGATVMGCGVSKGFGKCDNDCNDADATIYPGATELCNNKDDNCNDRIDENARNICGVGWCAQYADGCTSSCTPGTPRVEECNDFDDDCDGVKDNGTDLQLCGQPGLVCKEGYCVAAGSGGPTTGTGGSTGTPVNAGGSSPGAGATSQPQLGAGAGSTASPASTSGCSVGMAGSGSAWAQLGLLLAAAALARSRRRVA